MPTRWTETMNKEILIIELKVIKNNSIECKRDIYCNRPNYLRV